MAAMPALIKNKDVGETIDQWRRYYLHPRNEDERAFRHWVKSDTQQPCNFFDKAEAMRANFIICRYDNEQPILASDAVLDQPSYNHLATIKDYSNLLAKAKDEDTDFFQKQPLLLSDNRRSCERTYKTMSNARCST